MQNVNEHIVQYNSSFEDIISGLTDNGTYSHLRLILSKNDDRRLGQKYLMVSRSAFGIVKLLDIDYGENRICMALQDISTGMIKNIHLDINDTAFSFLLISWQDILSLENIGYPKTLINDDLLEFDYDC